MKSFRLIIILLVVKTICLADYWDADYRLPRLKGIKKILIKETRWDNGSGNRQSPHISRSVLWLNKSGLVIREDKYEDNTWLTGYNTYEYLGDDTLITTIRLFRYAHMQVQQKPKRTDALIQTVEFIDEHNNPLRHQWLFFQVDTMGSKRLLNSTSCSYNSNHQIVDCIYKNFETMFYVDSTVCLHAGDTQINMEYTNDNSGTQWPLGQFRLKGKDVVVNHTDSLGRIIRSESIANTSSGILRKSEFIYDNQNRYLGERYQQECEQCKTGWQKGGDRRSYDAKSRLKSVAYTLDGKPQVRFDLTYMQ